MLALPAFGRYLPTLADWMSSTPNDQIYLAGPSFGWAIALLDLGVFLPLTVAACVGLNRRRPWAAKALYTTVGWFGFVGPAVAAMAITMAVNDDPNASTGNAVFMSMLGLVFLALALVIYEPLGAGKPLLIASVCCASAARRARMASSRRLCKSPAARFVFEWRCVMSDLIAVAYPDRQTADAVRSRLMEVVSGHVIELEARSVVTPVG